MIINSIVPKVIWLLEPAHCDVGIHLLSNLISKKPLIDSICHDICRDTRFFLPLEYAILNPNYLSQLYVSISMFTTVMQQAAGAVLWVFLLEHDTTQNARPEVGSSCSEWKQLNFCFAGYSLFQGNQMLDRRCQCRRIEPNFSNLPALYAHEDDDEYRCGCKSSSNDFFCDRSISCS